MGRLKRAILKQIQQREPAKTPGYILDKDGGLVRHLPETISPPSNAKEVNTDFEKQK